MHNICSFFRVVYQYGAARLHDQTLFDGNLGIDDGRSRCTQPDVIDQADKLDVKDGTLSDPADADTSTVVEVFIEPGLRPVGCIVHDDSLSGRGGYAELLRLAGVLSKRLLDLCDGGRGRLCKLDGDAAGVAVDDGDAGACGGDVDLFGRVEVKRLVVGRDAAENLVGLPLDFIFFTADEGDDVVHDIQAAYAGVACAGDGLERGDHDGLEGPKGLFEGSEGDDEAGGGAVGVGDDVALFKTELLSLVRDDGEVGGVDERDDERAQRVSAVVFGVGVDDEVCCAECVFCGLSGG